MGNDMDYRNIRKNIRNGLLGGLAALAIVNYSSARADSNRLQGGLLECIGYAFTDSIKFEAYNCKKIIKPADSGGDSGGDGDGGGDGENGGGGSGGGSGGNGGDGENGSGGSGGDDGSGGTG